MKFLLTALAAFLFILGALSRALAAPSFSVTSPASGKVITGSSVTVSFSVTGFNLIDYRTHTQPAFGQGHILLWLDQTVFSQTSAVKVFTPSYTFTNLKPGPHTLRAELVTNNHLSLIPPAATTVNFTTAATASTAGASSAFVGLLLAVCVLLAAAFYLVDNERKALARRIKKTTKN